MAKMTKMKSTAGVAIRTHWQWPRCASSLAPFKDVGCREQCTTAVSDGSVDEQSGAQTVKWSPLLSRPRSSLNHFRRDLPSSSRFARSTITAVVATLPESQLATPSKISAVPSFGQRCCYSSTKMAGSGVKIPPRALAELEESMYSAVSRDVKDPQLGKDLKSLKWLSRRVAVSDDGTVQILLNVPTLLHPSLEDLKTSVQQSALKVIQSWISKHSLTFDAKANVQVLPQKAMPWMVDSDQSYKEIEQRLGPGLKNVSHFLAVYSCKGGVGKSTIAANLAYELARMGGRVGLLDVDVYGPSLPVLVQPDDPAVRQSPLGSSMVYPIQHKGIKMLSLGFVSPQSGVPGSGSAGEAAVMRGPMAGRVVAQLLKGTDWGELDVLILDLPPGTGDVQLAVCQDLQLSGAVSVTTPSKLAVTDARKGIEMFSTLGVRTIAVVENMSYFECEGGGKHYPFGRGFKEFLEDGTEHLDINRTNICQLPISEITNDATDAGVPLCLSRPDVAQRELDAFGELAKIVARELFQLPHKKTESQQFVKFEGTDDTFDIVSLQLSLDKDGDISLRAFSEKGAVQKKVDPFELRSRDPKTGAKEDATTEKSTDASSTASQGGQKDGGAAGAPVISLYSASEASEKKKTIPVSVEKKGGYGYAVEWADGATYIYSLVAIAVGSGGSLV